MIEFKDLVKGNVYKLTSRNLSIGVFNGVDGFIGIRTKFGNRYLFTEIEWDQDKNYGTARALGQLGAIPEDIILREHLGTECEYCHKPVNFDMTRPERERWHHNDDTLICEGKGYGPVTISNKKLFAVLEEFEKNANS